MDPSKIEAIIKWPQPVDGKGMQHFMGAANFHREFSQEFARIAVPLNECYSKENYLDSRICPNISETQRFVSEKH